MFVETKREGEQSTKTIEPWRQLLLDAADYMEAHGFAQCCLLEDDGRVCARGAIMMAAGAVKWLWCPRMSKDQHAQYDRAEAKLERFLKLKINGIPSWNNAAERTGPEVIAAMRACARSTS